VNVSAAWLPFRTEMAWEPVHARADWESLFARVPRPHLTQSWSYGEAKRVEGWTVERLVCGESPGSIALCQLLVKRRFGIRITRINRGPLFLDEQPSAQVQLAALRALRQRWRWGVKGVLLLAPSLPHGEPSKRLLREAGFRPRGLFAWGSSLIDLESSPENLFRQLSPEWRTKLRRAERLGVSLRVRADAEAIEWMVDRHVDNMRRKDFAGPSASFVRALTDAEPGSVRVLQAIIDGAPHAATLIVRFGRHAENYIGWFDELARRSSAGNFLMWQSVLEMQRLGCRALDLGGFSVADRYGQFKRGMRGREYRLAGEWLAF
jgi:lipid II:glycine glycyltransferase (peptidoglycan interpeptide bridge formation enzyme)